MENRRIKLIANPASGRGKAARLAELVRHRLEERGFHVEYRATRQRGDASRFAGDSRGYTAIACIGGDGTINEVINGLPKEGSPPIAAIPSGTANVLAKQIGLPWVVEDVTDVIADGRVATWDIGVNRLTGQRFLLFASAGYDAHVAHLFHEQRQGRVHMAHYIWWGLKLIVSYRAPKISVEVDGTRVDDAAALVQVANVADYGGPLVFAPHAKADDGVFEVLIQRGRRKRDTLRIFFSALVSYLFRRYYSMKDVVFVKGRRVRLWSTGNVPVQIDGDPAGHLPLDLEVIRGGLRLLIPRPGQSRLNILQR